MLPLHRLMNQNDRLIYPTGSKYTTLFPNSELSEIIKEAIIDYYYDARINDPNPQYWLRRFHRLVLNRETAWNKMVESINIPVEDNGRYNYDMIETEQATNTGSSTSSGTSTGSNTSSGNGFNYASDTPEGQIADIEDYMSNAGKSYSEGVTESTSTNASTGESSGTGNRTMTRKGNIGVMTAAQILDGYRDCFKYDAFKKIYSELESMFILVWGEEEEGGYMYAEYLHT